MKALLLATALILAAAAPALADGPVALTVAESGTAVSLAAGDSLTLTLPTQGGVPYAWTIVSEIEPQLTPIDQQTVAKTPGMAGGSASLVITLSAVEPGTVELTAGLFPFTGEQVAVQTVTYTVTVTP